MLKLSSRPTKCKQHLYTYLLSPRSSFFPPSITTLLLKMASLLSNDSLKFLYEQVTKPRNLEADTAKFWMAIFNSEFSAKKDEVYCVQETPDASESRRRVDATVYRIVNGRQRNQLYAEFKRPGLSPRKVKEAEGQIESYCKALIRDDTKITSIRALCCHGTKVAIWKVSKHSVRPRNLRYYDAKSNDLGKFRGLVHRINSSGL